MLVHLIQDVGTKDLNTSYSKFKVMVKIQEW